MIEIFTSVAGQNDGASRVFSSDIRLSAPSDVHFGSGAPGIAFYEKSGADLRVTLLDGQEVMIRDFFVIGESGQYSRLRDGGAAGNVEVTGLIAPEPYVPPGVTQTAATDSPLPQADTSSTGALSDPEAMPAPAEVVEVSAGGAATAPASTVPEGSAGSAGNTFGGLTFDQIAFGLSMLPAAGVIARSDKDDAPAPPPAAPVALRTLFIAADEELSDENDDGEDEIMSEDLAALIRSIASGESGNDGSDDQLVSLFGAPGADDMDAGFGGADQLTSLFDPMQHIAIEG